MQTCCTSAANMLHVCYQDDANILQTSSNYGAFCKRLELYASKHTLSAIPFMLFGFFFIFFGVLKDGSPYRSPYRSGYFRKIVGVQKTSDSLNVCPYARQFTDMAIYIHIYIYIWPVPKITTFEPSCGRWGYRS